jgi:hypothetical protein
LWMPPTRTWGNMWGFIRSHAWDSAHAWARSCVPICDGASNLGQVKAWGKLPCLIIKSHHESG